MRLPKHLTATLGGGDKRKTTPQKIMFSMVRTNKRKQACSKIKN